MGAANQMRLWSRALIDIGHELDIDSGLKLSILPSVDDGCTFNIGDGTQDIDVKLFGGLAALNMIFDVGNSRMDIGTTTAAEGMDVVMFGETAGSQMLWDFSADTLILNASKLGEYRMKAPVAKTVNYTVLESDSGTIFTNKGDDNAITFTLPTLIGGLHYWFFCAVDEDMTIASAAGNDMVVFNDENASSIKFGTTTEQIGMGLYVVADGTAQWLCALYLADQAFSTTIV